MQFRGRIYKLMPLQEGTSTQGNPWQRLEFIFEYFEQPTDRYSDKVVLSIMNDRIRECDLHEGDEVIIGFGHSVREYNGRYYNELRAYKIEKFNAPYLEKREAEQLHTEVPVEGAVVTDEQPAKVDKLPF